jgi:lysophospholipase L1-like esterase
MSDSKSKALLTVSLLINAVALIVAGYSVVHRGGWDYIRERFGKSQVAVLSEDDAIYLTRNSLFEVLPEREGSIVFFGDSQTSNCEWNEFFPGAINRGINGDTSAGLLKRVDELKRDNPRAVFILIGINDYARGVKPSETAANIAATVSALRTELPDATIYVESILPTRLLLKNDFAKSVNQLLAPLADNKKVFFLDIYGAFLEGDLLSSKLTFDGGHLNGAGLTLWTQQLAPYVRPLVKPGA